MKFHVTAVLVVLFLSQQVKADESIRIKDIWINEAPPTIRVFAGYMTIENHTSEAISLINATSPAFEKIEFHRTVYKDGLASMKKQESIDILPGSELTFSPGGYHLMMFNNNRPVTASDSLPISFVFTNGIKKTVSASIRKPAANTHHH